VLFGWRRVVRAGIYGRFNLDGEPISGYRSTILGVCPSPGDTIECDSAVAVGSDPADPGAVHAARVVDDVVIFMGHLDEPLALADTLGLAHGTPAALLVRAALAKFGRDAPLRILGEWSCALWSTVERRLVVTVSLMMRDEIFYTVNSKRVLIAPDLNWLAQQPCVGRSLNQDAFAAQLGRRKIQRALGDCSLISGVHAVLAGTRVTFAAGNTHVSAAPELPKPEPFVGQFDDAVGEVDSVLRRIMSQQLERAPNIGLQLSGGLDSSLLTCIAAEERQSHHRLSVFCSATAPDSAIGDETAYAQIVTDHLGLALDRVVPSPATNVYCPDQANFSEANAVFMGPRHYLEDAIRGAVVGRGATAVVIGIYGEMTITNPQPLVTIKRDLWQRFRRFVADTSAPSMWSTPDFGGFNVRLSSHRLKTLPDTVMGWADQPLNLAQPRRRRDLIGWGPGHLYCGRASNEALPGRLRYHVPFRDLRLQTLVAGFPAAFLEQNNQTRALARAVLKGHIPDEIRLRKTKMPFSPDYDCRLQANAPAALTRIPAFRAAEVDDWLDLDWLDEALRTMSVSGPRDVGHAFEVQLTAMVAEYLLWWRTVA